MIALSKITRGLQILQNAGATECATSSDVIYVGPALPETLTAEALYELEELGWFWSPESESWGRWI